jgi:hypothetical protein
MSKPERTRGRTTGTVKPGDRGGHGSQSAGGTTQRDVEGSPAETPVPPELPLDDDGNDARNIGG